MSLLSTNINRALQSIAAICFLAVANVIICFTVGAVVMFQVQASLAHLGLPDNLFYHYLPLIVAILSAAACNAYIVFNHKIRNFINKK